MRFGRAPAGVLALPWGPGSPGFGSCGPPGWSGTRGAATRSSHQVSLEDAWVRALLPSGGGMDQGKSEVGSR